MKKVAYVFSGFAVLLILNACSSADVSGDESLRKSGDMTFRNEGAGTQNITVNIKGSSDKKVGTSQTTDNDPTNRPVGELDVGLDEVKAAGTKKIAEEVIDNSSLLLNPSRLSNDSVDTVPKTDTEKIPVSTANAVDSGYETQFHHTTTASSDGGKSLVLCQGQDIKFDKCTAAGIELPYHGTDAGRTVYWNMSEEPIGDILCEKDGQVYKYLADKTIVYGDCTSKKKASDSSLEKTEILQYEGRVDDKPTWWGERKMKKYPDEFVVVVEGCDTLNVVNNKHLWEGSGYIVEQSSPDGGKLRVIAPASCNSTEAFLSY